MIGEFVATFTRCIQVGQDTYKDVQVSGKFLMNSTLGEILTWAKKENNGEYVPIALISISSLHVLHLPEARHD